MRRVERLHAQSRDNAVRPDDAGLAPLARAANAHRVTLACGSAELDAEFSRGTLYNTVIMLGRDGSLLYRHRKLMPTGPERMQWGIGDATGLRAFDTACGRVGKLQCSENCMPLARAALHAQGVEIPDLARVGMTRRRLDVAGHCARPDLLRLHMNSWPTPALEVEHDAA